MPPPPIVEPTPSIVEPALEPSPSPLELPPVVEPPKRKMSYSKKRRSSKYKEAENTSKDKSKKGTDPKEGASKRRSSTKSKDSKDKDKDDDCKPSGAVEKYKPKSQLPCHIPCPCQCQCRCRCQCSVSKPNRTVTIINPSLELQERVMRGEFPLDAVPNERRDYNRDYRYERRRYSSRDTFDRISRDTLDRFDSQEFPYSHGHDFDMENNNLDRRGRRRRDRFGARRHEYPDLMDDPRRPFPDDRRAEVRPPDPRRYDLSRHEFPNGRHEVRLSDSRDRRYGSRRPDSPDPRGRRHDPRFYDQRERRFESKFPDQRDRRYYDPRMINQRDGRFDDKAPDYMQRDPFPDPNQRKDRDPLTTSQPAYAYDRKDSDPKNDGLIRKQQEYQIKQLRTELEEVKKAAMVLIQKAKQQEQEEELKRLNQKYSQPEATKLEIVIKSGEDDAAQKPPMPVEVAKEPEVKPDPLPGTKTSSRTEIDPTKNPTITVTPADEPKPPAKSVSNQNLAAQNTNPSASQDPNPTKIAPTELKKPEPKKTGFAQLQDAWQAKNPPLVQPDPKKMPSNNAKPSAKSPAPAKGS